MASLTKRSGVYYARHIYRVGGKRKEIKKSLDTTDHAVAMRRLMRWEVELEAMKHGELPRLTFNEVSQRFLNEHCRTLKPNSVERYTSSVKFLKEKFGLRSILDISRADLLEFETYRRKHKVATATIRRDFNCLSSIFGFAISKEWAETNPVRDFLKSRKAVLKEGDARRRYLDHAEEARLIAACMMQSGGDPHLRTMLHAAVVLAIDTGLRKEELLSLKWSDMQISSAGSFVTVAKEVAKSGKGRRVPIFDRGSNVVSALPVHPTSPYVFWWKDGKRIGSFKKAFAAACARAKIGDFVWHDLRRTCGCRLLQDHAASMEKVKTWLGHSSIAVTEKHYAFLKEEQLDEIVMADRARRAEQPSAEILPMRRKVV